MTTFIKKEETDEEDIDKDESDKKDNGNLFIVISDDDEDDEEDVVPLESDGDESDVIFVGERGPSTVWGKDILKTFNFVNGNSIDSEIDEIKKITRSEYHLYIYFPEKTDQLKRLTFTKHVRQQISTGMTLFTPEIDEIKQHFLNRPSLLSKQHIIWFVFFLEPSVPLETYLTTSAIAIEIRCIVYFYAYQLVTKFKTDKHSELQKWVLPDVHFTLMNYDNLDKILACRYIIRIHDTQKQLDYIYRTRGNQIAPFTFYHNDSIGHLTGTRNTRNITQALELFLDKNAIKRYLKESTTYLYCTTANIKTLLVQILAPDLQLSNPYMVPHTIPSIIYKTTNPLVFIDENLFPVIKKPEKQNIFDFFQYVNIKKSFMTDKRKYVWHTQTAYTNYIIRSQRHVKMFQASDYRSKFLKIIHEQLVSDLYGNELIEFYDNETQKQWIESMFIDTTYNATIKKWLLDNIDYYRPNQTLNTSAMKVIILLLSYPFFSQDYFSHLRSLSRQVFLNFTPKQSVDMFKEITNAITNYKENQTLNNWTRGDQFTFTPGKIMSVMKIYDTKLYTYMTSNFSDESIMDYFFDDIIVLKQ